MYVNLVKITQQFQNTIIIMYSYPPSFVYLLLRNIERDNLKKMWIIEKYEWKILWWETNFFFKIDDKQILHLDG